MWSALYLPCILKSGHTYTQNKYEGSPRGGQGGVKGGQGGVKGESRGGQGGVKGSQGGVKGESRGSQGGVKRQRWKSAILVTLKQESWLQLQALTSKVNKNKSNLKTVIA